ncbi:transient receptor potential cation channel subfamily A member 1 [Spatholobus suberectus]|nr:transient receptor potential cation channel subfamily A member 1 [Spatholobus suberectus]
MGERKYITFADKIVKAQKAARDKNWKDFKKIFDENKELLSKEFDLFGNTPIHAAARSGEEQLLRELLQMLSQTEQLEALRWKNYEGNTPLHEVIFLDDPNMVDVIMKIDKIMPHNREPLLELTNNSNETPAYRAAEYGKLRVLKHLRAKYGIEPKHFPPNISTRRQRPILDYCVLTFNFSVAIWLLEKLDKEKTLAQQKVKELKEKNEKENEEENTEEAYTGEENTKKENNEGVTCLKLLSKMPMAFMSTGTVEMRLTERLIYELLPEDGYESELELEDDAGNNSIEVARDVESSQPSDGNKKTNKPKVGVVCSRVNYAFWKLAKGFSSIRKIWDQKKRHKFAQRLVELLLDREDSWKRCPSVPPNEPIEFSPELPSNVTEKKEHIELKDRVKKEEREKALLQQSIYI